jgi:TPR repeat protein
LPAREASGFVYNDEEDNPGFSGHAWAEVIFDGHWVGVDPMWGEREITPIRLKLGKLTDIAFVWEDPSIKVLEKKYKFVASDKEIEIGKELNKKKDYEKEIAHWKALANKGDALAQFSLGLIYLSDELGVPKDHKTAFKWFSLAAKQGYAPAQFNVGVMYANGEGVQESTTNATFWFSNAARQGDLEATYFLAEAYEKGEGVPIDRQEAFDLYKAAAGISIFE